MLIYTDGSSERFPTFGWVGGYGVYSGAGIEVSDFVPLHLKQTINSAELLVAPVAMTLHADHLKIALSADSEYVLLGVKGAARRWKINGWKGSSGPVSNVPIWEELLQFLDDTFQEIKWVKVPSHVNAGQHLDQSGQSQRFTYLGMVILCGHNLKKISFGTFDF